MSDSDTTPPVPDRLPDEAIKAIAEAYYERAAQGADAARERAQTAFTMASAIAAALAAAGIFGNIDRETRTVQILGFLAFAGWLLTALLLLHAAVGEYLAPADDHGPEERDLSEGGTMKIALGDDEFVATVYSDVVAERNAVYDRLRRALGAAGLAIVLTGAAAGAALLSRETEAARTMSGDVELTDQGMKDIGRACPVERGKNPIRASLVPASLKDRFVELELPAGSCDGAETTLELPATDVKFFESASN
jgi:hypothetical protein